MRHLSPRFPLLLTAHLLFAQFTPLVAQTAAPSGTPAVRLEQLDNTFFATLRKFQGPIIQEYLNELDKLKQTLLEKNKGIDAELVQAEIDKVKKTSPGMGLLPYDVLSAPAKERRAEEAPLRKLEGRFSPPSKPAPPPAIDNAPNPPSIFLIAGKEARSSLDRAVPKEKPDVKSLPLGMAEWQLENLPAGGYYVSIFYSCSENTEGATISAQFGGGSVRHKFTQADNTDGINSVRAIRLGTITLEKELTKGSLIVQSTEPGKPTLWLRQVVLTPVEKTENK